LAALDRVAACAPEIMDDAVDHLRDLTGPASADLVERMLARVRRCDGTKEVSNGT
jgi:hypothetical protein